MVITKMNYKILCWVIIIGIAFFSCSESKRNTTMTKSSICDAVLSEIILYKYDKHSKVKTYYEIKAKSESIEQEKLILSYDTSFQKKAYWEDYKPINNTLHLTNDTLLFFRDGFSYFELKFKSYSDLSLASDYGYYLTFYKAINGAYSLNSKCLLKISNDLKIRTYFNDSEVFPTDSLYHEGNYPPHIK